MNPHDLRIDLPNKLARAFAHQRAAWSAAPYPSWPERADRLRRLQAILREREAAISQERGRQKASKRNVRKPSTAG